MSASIHIQFKNQKQKKNKKTLQNPSLRLNKSSAKVCVFLTKAINEV